MSKRSIWTAAALMLLAAASTKAEETRSWTERISLGGDFRYRNEGIYAEARDSAGVAVNLPDRVRHRIRARLQVTAKINRYWDTALRLATSSPTSSDVGDPISTVQDLGGGLAPKTVWLDRAYATFIPAKQVTVTGGKFGVPYQSTDLHFDPDLNLEGIAVGAQGAGKDAMLQPFARVGGYWLQERTTGPDQGMFGAQIGARVIREAVTLTAAAAYYDYTNVNGFPTLFQSNRGFGNTTINGLYVTDFDIVDLNLMARANPGAVEATVLGNYVQNIAADSLATAWLAGLQLNGSAPFAWDLGYNYRAIERDAMIGAFTDSDFAGGGTNAQGHKVWLGVTPVANMRVGATWFINQRDPEGDDLHYERVMADLEVKF